MTSEIIFYSTHCPRCRVLEMKLKQKNIHYTEENDVEKMLSLNIKSAPALGVNGDILNFAEAVRWLNSLEDGRE